jgi:Lamin Tail Domain/PEP-CTERM motif
MKTHALKTLAAALLSVAALSSAQAQLIISEVAPYASGNTPFAADWFELTNTGSAALSVSGWRMDDNSNAFTSAVAMSGISSIAAGESVVFMECATGCAPSTLFSNFRSYWGAPAASIQIGTYGGAGVGLGAAGDAVNIFNSTGALLANVSFGASTVGRTFDNSAGSTGAIATLSSLGVNGAYASVGTWTGVTPATHDIGSPGTVAPIPEPHTYAMFASGLLAVGFMVRRRPR